MPGADPKVALAVHSVGGERIDRPCSMGSEEIARPPLRDLEVAGSDAK